MARYLFLVRHADTGREYEGRFIGRRDVPLSERGLLQGQALSRRLRRLAPASCFSSPLRRCLQTAEASGWTAECDPALAEVDFGQWEGKTFAELSSVHPKLVQRWASFDEDFAFPGGESLNAFWRRVRKTAQKLSAQEGERVLAFTHGGVIRALICCLLGLRRRQYVLFEVAPASFTSLALFDGKGVLTCFNDLCHLEGG